MSRKWLPWVLFCGLWTCLGGVMAAGCLALPGSPWAPYAGHDGEVHIWNQVMGLRWSEPFDFSPFNPLSGLGSVFPVNLPWLNPGAWVLLLPIARPFALTLSYLVQAAIFLGGVWALARALGLGRGGAHLAAVLAALLMLQPFAGVWRVLNFFSSSPVNLFANGIANLGFAVLLTLLQRPAGRGAVGRGHAGLSLALLGITAAGAISALFLMSKHALLYGPMLLGVVVFGRPTRIGALWAGGSLALLGLGAWALALPDYLGVATASAGRMLFQLDAASWAEMTDPAVLSAAFRDFDLCHFGGVLLCVQRPHAWVQLLALVPLVAMLGWGSRVQRVFALVTGIWIVGVHLFAVSGLWVIPHLTINHIGLTHLPPLCIALAWGIGRWRWGAPLALAGAVPAAVVLSLLALPLPGWRSALAALPAFGDGRGHPVIPADQGGAVIETLAAQSALAPGAPFRGYAVATLGSPGGPLRQRLGYANRPSDFFLLLSAHDHYNAAYGSGYNNAALWSRAIPTYNEYTQAFSKQFLAFTIDALSEPGDVFHHNGTTPSRVDLDLFRALGVRFILSDIAPAGTMIRAEQTTPGVAPLVLSEIAGANIGGWNPQAVQIVSGWPALIAATRAQAAQLAELAISETALPSPLGPARIAEMRLAADGWQMRLVSESGGLVLLPLQYTHCWRWEGSGAVSIHRVNAVASALYVRGEASGLLRLAGGPADGWACRKADLSDYRRWSLSEPFDRSMIGRARLRRKDPPPAPGIDPAMAG